MKLSETLNKLFLLLSWWRQCFAAHMQGHADHMLCCEALMQFCAAHIQSYAAHMQCCAAHMKC